MIGKRFSAALLLALCSLLPAQTIDLSGPWGFALDPADVGSDQQWYNRSLDQSIRLPGVLQGQGYGDPASKDTPWVLSLYDRSWHLRSQFKKYAEADAVWVPFLSQPPRHYLGSAWYQRDIEIPADWQGRRVALVLERTRWETTAWLDDRHVGTRDSLVAPHAFELGTPAPGRHRLTIRVDNRMKMNYRPDAHSVSDSLGSTWNGIVGSIRLVSTTPVWIDEVQAFGDIQSKSVNLEIGIKNASGRPGKGVLTAGGVRKEIAWEAESATAELVVQLGKDAKLWDEFTPNLHTLTVTLHGDNADDRRDVSFGLRRIGTDGPNLLVNGRRSHFRGTHSGGDYPLTGYPACDLDYWLKLFATCKEWGLNHMRFHSFCPPEAAFEAADRLGFYLQPEAGMWNEISPGSAMEKRMYEETDRMIRAYGNHPSFVLMSPSNEPKGRWKDALPKWVDHYRARDPRRLYTTGTGWPLIDNPGPVQGADFLAVHRVGPRLVRGNSAWFGRDYLGSVRSVDVPIIVHELGQWCAYPDFDVIDKFTGYLRPGNYLIFRDMMKQAGLLEKNKAFAMASGRWQAACYKEEIEANLRTPGLAGFQLLDLHDYLGQGTALVGVLDAFWEEKGYIIAKQWRRFCNTTVPLAVLRTRVFTTEDPFDVEMQIAHYGPAPIDNAVLYWRIVSGSKTVRQGELAVGRLDLGSAIPVGTVRADLSDLPAPAAYSLVAGIKGTTFENDWNFWLYPPAKTAEADDSVTLTRSFDEAVGALRLGGRVLLVPEYNQLAWQSPPVGRVPIFWNRLMGPSWERFLGLLCKNEHPALAAFPTADHYDWQWEQVLRASRAINIAGLPADIDPIVQVIDDWNRNYKLAAVFECQVGEGRLLVCAADIVNDLARRPAAAQLRAGLLNYMRSEDFNPAVRVSAEQLLSLRFDNAIMKKLGAVASADSDHGGTSAPNAVDGNPNTCWTTAVRSGGTPHPHALVITFPKPVKMTGLVLLNRQDHREREGDICKYRVETSADGTRWQTLTEGELESTFDPQTVHFAQTVTAQAIRLTALSGFGRDRSASLAEVAVIYAGAPLMQKAIGPATVYRKTGSATEEMDEGIDTPAIEQAQ